MAQDGVIAAALERYDALAASAFPGGVRPPAHFAEAPAVESDGDQLRPPYVVLRDLGLETDLTFEPDVLERQRFALEVYAPTLADADHVGRAVKYNGAAPSATSGFDFGVLALNPPLYHMALIRTGEQRFLAGTDKDAQRVHALRLEYVAQSRVQA